MSLGNTTANKRFAQGSGVGQKAFWVLPSHISQPKPVGTVGALALVRA